MTNLLTKRWKTVKPKLPYEKFVIVPDNWECSCEKDDSYTKVGCHCQLGHMAGLSFGWEKREIAEHIVNLHNVSLNNDR